MKLKIHKARKGARRSTIALSKKTRDALGRAYGVPVSPGFPVQVEGSEDCAPRNLIVVRMHRDDPLLRTAGAARIGASARRRLGVRPDSRVDVRPLRFEVWYHGTRASDPMVIVNDGWIVGSGAAYGPGIYMTTDLSTARAYGQTGLFTCEVAWGHQLNWPLQAGPLASEFDRWCAEHHLDSQALRATNPPWTDANILRWARLAGHYLSGGSAAVRVFPGPVGAGFKPNRVRIVRLARPDGTVIWDRGRRSHQR